MIDPDLRAELSRQGVFTTTLDELYNWGRKNSVWPLGFGLACCAIEMIATSEVRISVVVPLQYAEAALRAVHTAFELDKPV